MPLHSCTLTDIDRYELATILAGLRLLQTTPALPPEIEEIATDCNEFTSLDSAQIEDLCERVNAAAEYPWRDVTEDDAETAALEARVAELFETIEDVAETQRAGEAHDRQIRDPVPAMPAVAPPSASPAPPSAIATPFAVAVIVPDRLLTSVGTCKVMKIAPTPTIRKPAASSRSAAPEACNIRF